MADVVRAIHRLPQRAQHRRLQERGIRAGFDCFHQRRVILGSRMRAARQAEAKFLEKSAQLFEFFRRRPFMHAVQAGMMVLFEEIGGAHVGRQHAFFDEPVRVVALNRHDILDFPLVVEQHHRFHRLKIDRAAFAPRFEQEAEQRI